MPRLDNAPVDALKALIANLQTLESLAKTPWRTIFAAPFDDPNYRAGMLAGVAAAIEAIGNGEESESSAPQAPSDIASKLKAYQANIKRLMETKGISYGVARARYREEKTGVTSAGKGASYTKTIQTIASITGLGWAKSIDLYRKYGGATGGALDKIEKEYGGK